MKRLSVGFTLVFFLAASHLGFVSSFSVNEPARVPQNNSTQLSPSKQSLLDVMDETTFSPAHFLTDNHLYTFGQLSLYPNIETIGVVLSGSNLPTKANLLYRQDGEAVWHTGHPLMRIDDGRLVGSLFGLAPSTSYSVKVVDGSTEISGSTSTQSVELPFTPSLVLHVNGAAPAGGDGSVTTPFQTIQEGVNHASPGTQVLVADGIYREAVTFPNSGRSNNWIQVKAEDSGAILDGSETLSGNVWAPNESKAHVWSTKIGASIAYLARDQKRFYMYDSLAGLLGGTGHNNIPMNEGWFIEPSTWKLYVRSLDDPAGHTWQVPRLDQAFAVDTHDWLWVEGFEMRYYGVTVNGCGVCTNNASHIVVRKNRIHNIQLGIFFNWNGGDNQGNDTRIEYNEIYDPPVNEWPWKAVKGTSMEGTAIVVRGHIGAIVRNNELHNFFNGIYVGSSGALENAGVAFDGDIYNNQIHNIGDDALEPEGTCINQRFRNNTVDSTLVGISLAPVTEGPTWVLHSSFSNYTGRAIKWDLNSDGIVLIYQNTSWTTAQNANGIDLINPVRNGIMRNNIFQSTAYAIQESATGSTGHDWNNDNFYTTRTADSTHFKWENVNYDSIAKLCSSTGLECSGYESPPGLANPGGGDFTLLASSPNIDRGVVIPGINDQFSGKAPDVGAFESVVDSVPTVLSIIRADANPTGAANVNFTVTFSEPVSGVDAVDFGLVTSPAITGASIASVTPISGATYTVGVNSGSGNGNIGLNIVDDDSIVDATNNPLGGAGAGNGNFNTGETYSIAKGFPTVTGILPADSSLTDAASVHFTVNFSKEVSGVDAGDFVLSTTGGTSGSTITDVSGSGATYVVTVSTGSGDGTLRLDLNDNDSILDSTASPLGGAGSGNGNFNTGGVYTIKKTPPAVNSILRVDPNPTTLETVHFAVTFSEIVSGVDAGDFALVPTNGLSAASVTSVGGSGNTYVVTVTSGTGIGNLRLDLMDNDSIIDASGKPLGGVGSGNGNYTSGDVYTVNRPAVTMLSQVFRSNGTYDGWVLESSENSNQGGSKDSAATTFNLGDDNKNRMYRAILHFSTGGLPDNAVITQAVLMIKKQGVIGTDPFTTHQNISIDIRNGAFGNFGPFKIPALQVSDFQAPADKSAVGLIQNNPVGSWYWSLLDASANPLISLTSATQFRLGFQLDDNNDLSGDYLKFFSGNANAAADTPQLVITYYIPK